jgi:photosystem II stability/assembly factor-like uncharacterized protein
MAVSDKLYLGTRKGLFIYSRSKGSWALEEVAFLGEPITMLLPHKDGSVYAVLTLGHFGCKLRRRVAGGGDWEELGVPIYPEGEETNAGPPMDEDPPRRKPASLSEIWALEGGGTYPDRLWAGTIPGGLFRSDDRGASWNLVTSLWNVPDRARWFGGGKDDPGIHSVSVDPRNADHVAVAISCGGVWHTVDGGEHWTCPGEGLRAEFMPPNLAHDPAIQDAHRIARCAANPDVLWMQHHNGIFRSADDGKHWRELTNAQPSGFGFAVAAHPHDSKTAWFVPAVVDQCRVPKDGRVVVSRTRDGGESFEVLSTGLPEAFAYDIVYRHGLDVDERGESLAMGSTTGGFWTSEDGGEHWSCLSHTLPPIYCVRFAPGIA